MEAETIIANPKRSAAIKGIARTVSTDADPAAPFRYLLLIVDLTSAGWS